MVFTGAGSAMRALSSNHTACLTSKFEGHVGGFGRIDPHLAGPPVGPSETACSRSSAHRKVSAGPPFRWALLQALGVATISDRGLMGSNVGFARIMVVAIMVMLTTIVAVVVGLDMSATAEAEGRAAAPSKFRGGPSRTGKQPSPSSAGEPSLRWRFETGGNAAPTPAVAGDTVYVASDGGTLFALEAATGAERWRFATGGGAFPPALADGVVYIGSVDGTVYAVDAATGVERW